MNSEQEDIKRYVQFLEKENQYLKAILEQAGINYDEEKAFASDEQSFCSQDQGGRIQHRNITRNDANLFFSMFWGRTDVYAKRSVNKSTGAASYYPQCNNFWKPGCPRKQGSKVRCQDCKKRSYKELKEEQIIAHLQGNASDATDVIGIYPLLPDDTCRFLVFDFDNHEKDAAKDDFANKDDTWREEVDALRKICRVNGIDALAERSRSGKGAHVWIFFQKPIEASLARKFGDALLKKGTESVNLKSFRYFDRMLPMQDHLPSGGLGNLIALPLQGQALKEGNSAFIDESWNAYEDQWGVLLKKRKYTKEFLESKIEEWGVGEAIFEDTEKPWDKTSQFIRQDVNGDLRMTLADGIYIETDNLLPRIQNRIRELAAFKNPVFYKNQAMGLSNFSNSRYIYLGCDENGYIKVPRGLQDTIITKCKQAEIPVYIDDKRNSGRKIDVEFLGELKENQTEAVEAMAQHEFGILSAATAFGKTVVCCNLIAKKKTSTLILLQSSTLIEQWREALEKFLIINEDLPEYKTPSGKVKKRKSLIGELQGAHDSTTGIIDIAMVGSICKKGEYHSKFKEYGLVILDECHHAAADTIVDILQKSNAKYIYGVTATPFREDRLDKINTMLLGPIRYKYTAMDRAQEQGIDHLVYPRFTRTVIPRLQKESRNINEAYELLRKDLDRDELIISDVKACIESGRTPVILSRYVDHTRRLYERLQKSADRVFLLVGTNSKKEHHRILEEMKQVKHEESMLLLATGKLVGEGFDFPRLDTLFMVEPIAGKSVVEQYAGRLNRDYEGKKDVIIYDYVDGHIPVLERMYHKRLKAYKQIGYEIYSEEKTEKKNKNTIFNSENYEEIYKQDLLEASEEIIISRPKVSTRKAIELDQLLHEKMENGLHVIIVTWSADSYGYGDSGNRMAVLEQLRQFGFEVNLVDDYCEHYCIVDRQLVWYGSMNLLGKEDIEDNLMRVCSRETATELLELTFGA